MKFFKLATWFAVCLTMLILMQLMSCKASEEAIIQKLLGRIGPALKEGRASDNGTSGPVTVNFSLQLISILDFDQQNQILTTLVWKKMIWKDQRLSWKPDDYNGVKIINLSPKLVWTPDVVLYNSLDIKHTDDLSYLMVIHHNGQCIWMPASVYRSFCQVNMQDFPYDTQMCSLKFGLWTHTETQVNLTISAGEESIDLSQYVPSMQWNLTRSLAKRTSSYYDCCGSDPFVDVTYQMELQRVSGFYFQFLLIPLIMLSLMVLAIFWIPPNRPDRTALGMSLFSSFMLLLLLIVQLSPPSNNIKLVSYCCSNITMIAVATVLSAIVVNINDRKVHISNELKGSREKRRPEVEGEEEAATLRTKSSLFSNHKKMALALVLDKCFFVVYVILTVVFYVLYFPKLP